MNLEPLKLRSATFRTFAAATVHGSMITFAAAILAPLATAATIEFHIPAGTGGNSWNSLATQVTVEIGDTLRIVNDDTVLHALHTDDDAPCGHGADMAPSGGFYDCVVSAPYDPAIEGALFDHYHPNAKFWVLAQ